MGGFWKLFDPLWRLIGANTWASSAFFGVTMVAAFLTGQNFAAMMLGGALGTVLMCRAESDRAALLPPEAVAPLPAE